MQHARKRKLDYARRIRREVVRIGGALVEFYREGRKWHWRAASKAVRLLTTKARKG